MAEAPLPKLWSSRDLGRRLAIALVIGLAVIAGLLRLYSGSRRVVEVFLHLPLPTLLGIAGLVLLNVLLQGAFMRSVYGLAGFRRSLLYGACLQLACSLVNTVAPVAGLSGTIYMLQVERENGLQRTQTLLVVFLFYLIDYGIFLLLLLLGSLYLVHLRSLSAAVIQPALILFGLILLLAVVGLTLLSHPSMLERLLHRVKDWHVLRDEQLTERNISLVADETRQAWQRVATRPGQLLKSLLAALLMNLTGMSALWLALRSSGVEPSLAVVAFGYLVATLFYIVSFTPSGVGIAEGALTTLLVSFGVPLERALVASLLYRGAIVVLPLVLGLPALHWISQRAGRLRTVDIY